MGRNRNFVFSLVLFALAAGSFAQKNLRDSSISATLILPSYSFQTPGADMAKRFGNSSDVGLQVWVKRKTKWIFGISADFIFGNQVREKGIFDSISTHDAAAQGFFISNEGKLVDSRLSERGFSSFLKFGRMFPMWGPNPNSGIVAMAGVGFLEHKIRIDLVDGNTTIVPQMNDQMKKGYDRLSYGVAFNQYIGYVFLSNNRIYNFFAGLEMTEGVTKNRRGYDYDLMKVDNATRTDLLYSIRVGWLIALYKRAPKEFYTY